MSESSDQKLEAIIAAIKKKITPVSADEERVRKVIDEFISLMTSIIREKGIAAKTVLVGSFAKGTWLPQKVEADIFILYSSKDDLKRNSIKHLEYFKSIFDRWEDRHAQHPYISGVFKGIKIDVVPSLEITDASMKFTAVDRSPLHTKYILSKINPDLTAEIRLLKSFLIGQNLYGAEIKIKGFSGYLCELLIIYYKSFIKLLKECQSWKDRQIIILPEKPISYDPAEKFKDPLIVIDPVDLDRNVASPVSRETLSRFIRSASRFMQEPTEDFFFPIKTVPLKLQELTPMINNTLFIITKVPPIPLDNLWGQLYRSLEGLKSFFELNDYTIRLSEIWTDEKDIAVFIFKFKSLLREKYKKREGPPLNSPGESRFLQKYIGQKGKFKEPFKEGGRWMIMLERGVVNAKDLIEINLKKDNILRINLGGHIREAFKGYFQILCGSEISKLYLENRSFAEFLTKIFTGELNLERGEKFKS